MNDTEPTANQNPEEERVLCTVCLHANLPRADYCSKCGALINTLLMFAPYDQILIEGFAYRRAVDGPPSRIILIGMWLVFGPTVVLALFGIAAVGQSNPALGSLDLVAHRVFFIIYFLISAAILYRTTANYLAKRQSH